MSINLIMPMCGGGTRFGNKGFDVPKPLIELSGKPFFYWAARSITDHVDVDGLIFVILQEHIEKYHIDEEIKALFPDAVLMSIPQVLNGAVLTCMEGIKAIDNNAPVLFNDCDHAFRSNDFYRFVKERKYENIDAALLTFYSDEDKYSFAITDTDGNVSGTVEKKAVSHNAICGAYYFRSKEIFYSGVRTYLKNCDYNEYFISGVYNELISAGHTVRIFNTDEHISFGTPEEYETVKRGRLINLMFGE